MSNTIFKYVIFLGKSSILQKERKRELPQNLIEADWVEFVNGILKLLKRVELHKKIILNNNSDIVLETNPEKKAKKINNILGTFDRLTFVVLGFDSLIDSSKSLLKIINGIPKRAVCLNKMNESLINSLTEIPEVMNKCHPDIFRKYSNIFTKKSRKYKSHFCWWNSNM